MSDAAELVHTESTWRDDPRVQLAWCLVKTLIVVAALLFFTAIDTDLSNVIYQNF